MSSHHRNSIAAANGVNVSERCIAALAVYVATIQPMTDREAGAVLHWDITSIRPRVSNLIAAGLLCEILDVQEHGSRNRVRCCAPTSEGRRVHESLNATHA